MVSTPGTPVTSSEAASAFGITTAEAARGPSLDQLLTEEEPDPVQDALAGSDGATAVPAASWLS